MSSFLVALRRLRDDRAAAVGLGVLVLVTALVFGAAPRLLDRVGDEALRGAVARADAIGRNIALVDDVLIPAADGAEPLANFDVQGDRLEAQMPDTIRDLVPARSIVSETFRFRIHVPTSDPAFVRLRLQPGADTRLHYVDGRAPTATTRTVDLPPDLQPLGDAGGSSQPTATAIEVALSSDAVRAIGRRPGDTIFLSPDPRDALTQGALRRYAAMTIVGAFEVDEPLDPFWYDDRGLERASIRSTGGDARAIDVTALLSPGEYAPALSLIGPSEVRFRTTWRLFVATDRLTVAGMDPLIRDLRRLDTTFGQVTSRMLTDPAIRSGLLPLVQAHAARWTSALAILSVVAIGPALAALAALALVATIAARRRRPALVQVRGRGATVGQVVRAVLLEGAVIVIPALGLAILAAIALLPGGSDRATIAAAVSVAAVALALLLATSLPGAIPTLQSGREVERARGPSARRLVLDTLIIAAAAAGAYLLRERGVHGASSTRALSGADPLIAAVPALAAVAVGLMVVRLVPVPLRLLGRVAGTRRGLVPVLGLRRAVQGGTATAVLLVLLAATAIGAFSSAALVNLDRTADAASWHQVGAPYRMTDPAGSLSTGLDPATVPGVRGTALAAATEIRVGIHGLRIQFLSIDAAAWETMVRGTAGDPGLPAEMLTPDAGPIVPIAISSTVAARADGVTVGQQFPITVNGRLYQARAVAALDAFPTVAGDAIYAIASRQQLKAVHPEAQLIPTTIFLDAPDTAAAGIREAIQILDPSAVVDSRAEAASEFHDSPVTGAIVVGVAAAALVAAVYAALAVTAALALAGSARAVEVAHLRMLGMSRRETVGLAIVEHGPIVLIAFLAGVGLGLGMFVLLEPGLGLDALVGSRIQVPLSIDPRQLGVTLLTILAIAAVGIGLAAWLQRRAVPVAALRRGFE